MKQYHKKEIAFERVLFFSDAVVAIAITLLALELRLNLPPGIILLSATCFCPGVSTWLSYCLLSM